MFGTTWKGTNKVAGYRSWLRLLAIVAVVTLFFSGSFFRPSVAHAAYNPGQVCNDSSVSIWLTLQPLLGNWSAYSLPAHQCTNAALQDAESVWARRCDSRGYNCAYVAWKVTGYTTTHVRDGYISPIPPGRTLYVSGFRGGQLRR